MKLIYRPDDDAAQEFPWHMHDLDSLDAEAIEEVGGPSWDNFDDFGRLFMSGNRKAWRAALWVCLRRENPPLRFHEVKVRVDQLDLHYEQAELDILRPLIMAADEDLPPEQREHLLRTALEQAREPDPKA